MNKFKEKSEISLHLVRVWNYLKSKGAKWSTNKDIQHALKFSGRTIRGHTLYLVRAGLVDQVEVFPGHRYKAAKSPEKRNRTFYDRIEHASEVLIEG